MRSIIAVTLLAARLAAVSADCTCEVVVYPDCSGNSVSGEYACGTLADGTNCAFVAGGQAAAPECTCWGGNCDSCGTFSGSGISSSCLGGVDAIDVTGTCDVYLTSSSGQTAGPYATGLHGVWDTTYPNGESIGDNAASIACDWDSGSACDVETGYERVMMIYANDDCTGEIGADGLDTTCDDLRAHLSEACAGYEHGDCISLVGNDACREHLEQTYYHWADEYGAAAQSFVVSDGCTCAGDSDEDDAESSTGYGYYIFEDTSRGEGCDALSYDGSVVSSWEADHCCDGEEYCCGYESCGAGSDACGYRFRCYGEVSDDEAGCSYEEVYGTGCWDYIHMDWGWYGGVYLQGGSTSLEDCAAAVQGYSGQDGCMGEYFFYEWEGYCNCPTDSCTAGYETGAAGGDGQLYKLYGEGGDCDIGEGCSQAWCTSPNGDGGYDCWAGSDSEECSCSEGKAKETGERLESGGTTYYEYTCCNDGSGHGEECGDCCTDVGLIILIVVLSVVGFVMCATCGGVAICYFAKCACFAPGPQQQQPGMEMVQMGQPQQGVIIQPQQHQGVIMGQPQQGVIVQAAPTKTTTL